MRDFLQEYKQPAICYESSAVGTFLRYKTNNTIMMTLTQLNT